MTKPARHLMLVEADEHGEIIGRVESDALQKLEAALERAKLDFKMAQRDVAAKNRWISELERNKVWERLQHPDRAFIVRVCRYWHKRCRRGSARIDPLAPNRFDAVAALAEMERIVVEEVDGKRRRRREWRYSAEMFKAAIDGGEYDPFETTHKNGKVERHNDLSQICKDVTRFERFVEKAPGVVGSFAGGDLVVPPVPGFERLSPVDLARAHETRNNPVQGSSLPSSLGGHISEVHRGYPSHIVGAIPSRSLGREQAPRPHIRGRLVAGAEGLPASCS